jgi:hypothetical protein
VKKFYGKTTVEGTSWSMSTVVYGGPDYARLFIQGGFRGEAVVCTVTVDGKVTDRRATDGPYGLTMCQG